MALSREESHEVLTGAILPEWAAGVPGQDHPVVVIGAGRTDADVEDRAQVLRADIRTAGVTYTELALDLALAFHHAVRDDHDQVAATIARLRENTRGGDFAYYSDITAFMAGLPLEEVSPTRWIDGAQHTRRRWRGLVTARRDALRISPCPRR
ncbi:hypothetical protein OG524_36415 (plasmid) [Streptomyces sp. NBC_01520]|uniref:hypothetical protein n=1 Tax=Streptomyces sp. NBC_01520 TaxID=2903892 RepID=UPI00386BF38A